MRSNPKISLYRPDSEHKQHFTFRLKSQLRTEPWEFNMPSKILVISNIDGKFHLLYTLLINCQVIDKNYRWIFNDGHLVIIGNCLGENQQSIECLWLIYSLEERARYQGGYVHFILGNQEISNINGSWIHLHPEYAVKNAKSKNRPTALYDGNGEISRWLYTKNIVEKIGDIMFVDKVFLSLILNTNKSILEINRNINEILKRYVNNTSVPNNRISDVVTNLLNQANSIQDITPLDSAYIFNMSDISTVILGASKYQESGIAENSKFYNVCTSSSKKTAKALLITNNNNSTISSILKYQESFKSHH